MSEDGSGSASESPSRSRPSAKGRKFERRSCRLRLRLRRIKGVGLYSADEKYIEGMIWNQSKGGLLIETPIYFAEGAKLEVAFHSPDSRQSFLGIVTIRWVKRVGDRFYLGVATDKLDKF